MKDADRSAGTNPVSCAAALILGPGRVLLGLRAPDSTTYPNVWDLFGGHVEGRETIEEALLRELREELDITATGYRFLTAFSEPEPGTNGDCLYHVYKVTAWSGPGPRLCGKEHSEIRWHSLDQALALNLAAPQYRALFMKHVN